MIEQQSTPAGEAPHQPVVEIRDRPESRRYEVTVDGVAAGFSDYESGTDQIGFTHIEIDDAFAGRGVAGLVARRSLDDARASGRSVLPLCAFYQDWIQRHPDYADLVPEHRRAEFGL